MPSSYPVRARRLIFASFPLLTMILATLLGYERLTAAKALGVILTGVGWDLPLGKRRFSRAFRKRGGSGTGRVRKCAGRAVCSVLYRPYLQKYPTLPVSFLAMLASVVFLAALAAGEGFFHSFPRFTRGVGWPSGLSGSAAGSVTISGCGP